MHFEHTFFFKGISAFSPHIALLKAPCCWLCSLCKWSSKNSLWDKTCIMSASAFANLHLVLNTNITKRQHTLMPQHWLDQDCILFLMSLHWHIWLFHKLAHLKKVFGLLVLTPKRSSTMHWINAKAVCWFFVSCMSAVTQRSVSNISLMCVEKHTCILRKQSERLDQTDFSLADL